MAALGEALPEYRWALAKTVIGRSASTAAAIAITPLPFLDFLPLVAIQSLMVLSIARVYSYRITVGRARELLFSLGIGFVGRTLFYELSKLGGPPGWLVAAGVASGVTVAMGYAVARWFESGTKVPLRSLRKISQDVGKEVTSGVRQQGMPTRCRRPAAGGKRPGRSARAGELLPWVTARLALIPPAASPSSSCALSAEAGAFSKLVTLRDFLGLAVDPHIISFAGGLPGNYLLPLASLRRRCYLDAARKRVAHLTHAAGGHPPPGSGCRGLWSTE